MIVAGIYSGDILVVDHYSGDRTVEVAKKLGAKVIKYKNLGWSESKEQMDFIFSHVKTDWICIGSADELIPETCLKLYKEKRHHYASPTSS